MFLIKPHTLLFPSLSSTSCFPPPLIHMLYTIRMYIDLRYITRARAHPAACTHSVFHFRLMSLLFLLFSPWTYYMIQSIRVHSVTLIKRHVAVGTTNGKTLFTQDCAVAVVLYHTLLPMLRADSFRHLLPYARSLLSLSLALFLNYTRSQTEIFFLFSLPPFPLPSSYLQKLRFTNRRFQFCFSDESLSTMVSRITDQITTLMWSVSLALALLVHSSSEIFFYTIGFRHTIL